MRDFADIVQLNILANLESLNAVMIEAGTDKQKRFELLVKAAISQYQRLSQHAVGPPSEEGFKGLEKGDS